MRTGQDNVVATVCAATGLTGTQACSSLCTGFSSCQVVDSDSGVDGALASVPGICVANPNAPAGQTSFQCTGSGFGCANSQCTSQVAITSTSTICFDPQTQAAVSLCNNTDLGDSFNSLSSPVVNDPNCPNPSAALATSTLTYALTPGQSTTYSAAGTTSTLQLTGGSAIVGQTCDADGEFCHPSSLTVNAFFAPTTILGQTINTPTATTARPLKLSTDFQTGVSTVAAGEGLMEVGGAFSTGPASILFRSNSPWTVLANSSGIAVNAAISSFAIGSGGAAVPFSANVQLTGVPSTSVATCAGLSSIQRLFGFESDTLWTSAAPLETVPAPVTQGCAALGFNGSGYQTISGAPFSTSRVSVKNALSVDLFVPGNQPNPSWLGALQMYLSCPSGNVFNNYIGQVELTGLPQNRYSTLRFPLPASTLSVLSSTLNDCSLSFAINVNPTGQAWLFDNLRFTD